MQDFPFNELKIITDKQYLALGQTGRTTPDFHIQIIDLLANHNIKVRQDDGSNPVVTISHPTSLEGSIVVGLRYTKRDGTKTEDLFLFQPGQDIQPYYKGKLENILSEYRGSHKLQR